MTRASSTTAPWPPCAGSFRRRSRGASGRSPRNSSSATGASPGSRNSGSCGPARNWSGIQEKEILAIAAEAADEAVRFGADFVGLKLWNGDGFSGSVRIAEAIRARAPRVRLIGGGPHADYFGGHILQHTDVFDQLIQGEGEQVLPAIDRRAGEQGRLAQGPGRGLEAREPDFLQPHLRGRGARPTAAAGL